MIANRLIRLVGASVAATSLLLTSLAAQGHQGATAKISLSGGVNFRDLGGYATSDGRHVRSGRLFRSGQLSELTPEGYRVIGTFGIAAICDFRGDDERRTEPTTWSAPGRPLILALPPTSPAAQAQSVTQGPPATPVEMRERRRAEYGRYIDTLTPSFRTALQVIRQTGGSVLFHCSAGKDRSGIFAALVLTMLGVPRTTVFEDFLLSNEFVAADRERVARFAASNKVTLEVARTAAAVYAEDLRIVFDEIDRRFGSFDNYRRGPLGVSDTELSDLRNRLLE